MGGLNKGLKGNFKVSQILNQYPVYFLNYKIHNKSLLNHSFKVFIKKNRSL
jgi:hypothetical protein